jgi:transcriptional antiterminator RfaH
MANWTIGQKVEAAARPLGEATSQVEGRRWALVNVGVMRETPTAERIADLGYLTYVPQFETKVWDRRRHRKRITVTRALFPGYLFAQFDPARDPWASIDYVPGVVRVVRIGDTPSHVPAELVAQLQAAESANHDERIVRAVKPLKRGDPVRVVDGPFADSIALFVKTTSLLDGPARIVALLDLLGRKVRIELDADQVARL